MKRHGEGEHGREIIGAPHPVDRAPPPLWSRRRCFPKIVGLLNTSSRDVRWRGRGTAFSETTSTSLTSMTRSTPLGRLDGAYCNTHTHTHTHTVSRLGQHHLHPPALPDTTLILFPYTTISRSLTVSKPLSIAIIGGGTSPLRLSRALGRTRTRTPMA